MTRTSSSATIITQENWQQAVVAAVEGLPDDVQASVGYGVTSPAEMVVRVAAEPHSADESEIRFRWWDTWRAQMDAAIAEEPSVSTIAGCYAPDDPRWREPILAMFVEAEGVEQGYFPGRETFGGLSRSLQLAVLEALWGGVGVSVIGKTEEGLYVRDDGTQILPWQEPDPVEDEFDDEYEDAEDEDAEDEE